jgi:hypothetical protein
VIYNQIVATKLEKNLKFYIVSGKWVKINVLAAKPAKERKRDWICMSGPDAMSGRAAEAAG